MTTLRRNVQLLTKQLNDKDMALLSVQSDLEWARERISRLDAALQQASSELKLRMDTAERWEFKAGDQQQQISELERIRKALTSQLHSLRQELVPKEEQIIHMNEQLQELDREYETSLGAVSEKELILKQNSTKLHVLQKQVSELRYALSRKDGALHRAAKIFDEYRHSVQRARFDSIKQPIKHGKTASAIDNLVLKSVSNGSKGLVEDEPQEPTESDAAAAAAQIIGNSTGTNSQKNSKEKKKTGKNEVEMMVITEPVERAWKRLGEILKPYINSGKNGAANVSSSGTLYCFHFCVSIYHVLCIILWVHRRIVLPI